jgi:hypothetical protein
MHGGINRTRQFYMTREYQKGFYELFKVLSIFEKFWRRKKDTGRVPQWNGLPQ